MEQQQRQSGHARPKKNCSFFRIGEEVNLDNIRNWVEASGDNFTDNFSVDDNDLIKNNPKGQGNETVMQNQVIMRNGENDYQLINEDVFQSEYEEYELAEVAARTEE